MKILVVDDHALIRRSIIEFLTSHPGWTICGDTSNGADACRRAEELKPDLILLDISMPGMNGLDAARKIRQSVPGVKILILTHHDRSLALPSALEAGADGCVEKGELATDLILALERIEGKKIKTRAR